MYATTTTAVEASWVGQQSAERSRYVYLCGMRMAYADDIYIAANSDQSIELTACSMAAIGHAVLLFWE